MTDLSTEEVIIEVKAINLEKESKGNKMISK